MEFCPVPVFVSEIPTVKLTKETESSRMQTDYFPSPQ